MSTLLWWLVQNTITIALMIPVVAGACRLCRNRPAVQHVLWAVVLLKFVTPPVVSWPWPVQHFSPPLSSIQELGSSARLSTPDERLTFVSDDVPIGTESSGAR